MILLVQRRGSLVTREEIAGRLWTDSSMVHVDQGINTAVNRAWEVLRDNASEPRDIETVVGPKEVLTGCSDTREREHSGRGADWGHG